MITSLLAAAITLAPAPRTVVLRYKFHSGDHHRYEMKMSMKMKIGSGAQNMPMNMDMDMVSLQTVSKVASDGSATVTNKVEKASMTGFGQSSKNNMVGKTVTMAMTPTGEFKGMSGSALGNSNPMGMSLSGLQGANVLPNSAVHVGSTWTGHMSLPGMGDIPLKQKLESITSKGGSTIAIYQGTGTVPAAEVMKAAKGMPNSMKVTGALTCRYICTFNVSSGVLIESHGSFDIDMHMSGSDPQSGKPMTASTSGGSIMTMKLLG